MTFDEVLEQAIEMLERRGRVTYRTLKRQFALDDEALDDLKFELIEGQEVAADKDGKMLVWTGGEASDDSVSQPLSSHPPPPSPLAQLAQPEQDAPSGERRQLTVMFCDLVGSTTLSEQLDPEELQTVVRTYQEVSAQVIERYEGYIAQYLGDGLLVYFGYPVAHEDDAARAVRAGLEIVTALEQAHSRFPQPIQIRIGIHTGPVVVGQMGGGSRHEQLALGETPNIAARVQGKARPDEVVISAATERLIAGLFETEDRGRHELKGISTPQPLYRVMAESAAQSRFAVAVRAGLTPLAGREQELGVLHERWTLAQAGAGQVVLLSGEPGIGKSRLVQELKDQVTDDGATQIAFQCSPYHQNSALSPLIAHVERLLQFMPNDTPQTKLEKLQWTLGRYRFPQSDTVPLFAALLSLPHPEDVPPLTMSPEKQKELTQAALVAWLLEEAEQQPVYTSWEDLHWADPSTLEVLSLLLGQVPTVRLLALLTFRPEFVPPWGTHSYLSHITLSRLGHPQVSTMVERVTGGKALPKEVLQQIVTKTDGVPLFVEELTKMVVESNLVREVNSHYELTGPLPPLAIPSTLQDSLMARLDRLTSVREVAQLGATIGREFRYELLQAVSPMDDVALQQGLQQLVEVELIYQRGLPPEAHYLFKHALIQDTAYESLLKSTRQQYHQQIAQVLEGRFPETVETQPELVAHHYTEAGLSEQATGYWRQAGQRAIERSANLEAIGYLTKALELANTVVDPSIGLRQELETQFLLGSTLMAAKGYTAPEVERAYLRARELCEELGESIQLLGALRGLVGVYVMRAEVARAHDLAEQCLRLAQQTDRQAFVLWAHYLYGSAAFFLGEFVQARTHEEHGLALFDPHKRRARRTLHDPGVACRTYAAWALWVLGYPDQARVRIQEGLERAHDLAHPYTTAYALYSATRLHQLCREAQPAHARAEATIALATEHGFPEWIVQATAMRGWALASLGEGEAGIAQLQQSMANLSNMGNEIERLNSLALLAEIYGTVGRPAEGLMQLAEALTAVPNAALHWLDAELHRLKGELTLQKSKEQKETEAEACFQKALEIARRQQAKSWELRAAISLARLWQQQGKIAEALELLAPVHNWFTEGFDTKDLQEAKALLKELT